MNFQQLAQQPLVQEVMVEEYRNGSYVGKHSSLRVNTSGVFGIMMAATILFLMVTFGLVFCILAPFLTVYLVKDVYQSQKAKALLQQLSLVGWIKLKMQSKISLPTRGLLKSLLFMLLMASYVAIAVLIWIVMV